MCAKTLDFAEDPNEEFEKSKISDLGSVIGTSYDYYCVLRVRDSSYLDLFFIFGHKDGRCSGFQFDVLLQVELGFA